MGDKALIENAAGQIDQIEIPEDVNAKTVKAAMKAILPAMKVWGESFGQSMRDAQEESLERIAKALEAGRPINREPNDDPDYGPEGNPKSVVGSEIVTPDEKRAITSLFFKAFRRRDNGPSNPERALKYIKEGQHGFGKRATYLAEKAMAEAVMSEGGLFIPEVIRDRIRELKDEALIMRQIAPAPLRLRGSITIPAEAVLATAYWADEAEELTITSFEHTFSTLTLKKLTALLVASNELLADATNFESKIEQHLRRAYGRALEPVYWYGTGSNSQPMGLRAQIASGNQFAHSGNGGTVTVQTIVNDLIKAKALVKLGEHTIGAGGDFFAFNTKIWQGLMGKLSTTYEMKIFATEIAAGRLMGVPYFESNHLPADYGSTSDHSEVFYGIRDYLSLYEGENISFDASRDASYRDSDSVVKSCFTHDQTAFRLIGREGFAVEYQDGFSLITDIETDGTANAWL
jgi:HK97 family phage major capsid protein